MFSCIKSSKLNPKFLLWTSKRYTSFGFPLEKAFINGKWVSAKSKEIHPVTNPASGDVIANVADCSTEEINDAIDAAYNAFKPWSSTTAKERSGILKNLFNLQMSNSKNLAEIMTAEGGKSIREAEGEIKYGASFLEWFAEEARRIYGDVIQTPNKAQQALFIREPVGVAGIITPWNFPNAMITRKVGPALAAGCTCVIKPAGETPLSALAFARLAEEAGVPPGVINVITTSRKNTRLVGKLLSESEKVATISFTGSTSVGKNLLQLSASTVKRVSLELGGNAPSIIFNSAKIPNAVACVMASKFRNSGQTCVCTNRILVQSGVHDEFVSTLKESMQKQLIVGDGMDPNVTIGPLINNLGVQKVDEHVKDALSKGADLILGGEANPKGENFCTPTLLTKVTPDMLVCQEETFGPLAAVVKFDTEEEALSIANSTRTGLAGYFFSEDIAQIWRVAKQLEVGMIGINEGIISTAEAAFGGIKESGIGREGSKYGIDEYVHMKYICFGNLN